MDQPFAVNCIADHFWELSQGGRVRCFLLEGEHRALLVDTCFGGEVLALCRTLTDKPVTLVTTHADFDHIGGDGEFADRYAHAAEIAHYREVCPDRTPPRAVEEGFVFDAAPFRLEAVHLPGHTPGSIALLDREHRFIITGDAVSTAPVFMFGPWRSVSDYAASLRKLRDLSDAFDVIYPSHGELPLPPAWAGQTADALAQILAGNGAAAETGVARFPSNVKTYSALGCQFYLEEL